MSWNNLKVSNSQTKIPTPIASLMKAKQINEKISSKQTYFNYLR